MESETRLPGTGPPQSAHVQSDASGVPCAHTGTSDEPARCTSCTPSSATDSYQREKSPRMRTAESPESTSIISHLLGRHHFLSVFLGSLTQPAVSLSGSENCVGAPSKRLASALTGNASVTPAFVSHVAHSSSTRCARAALALAASNSPEN